MKQSLTSALLFILIILLLDTSTIKAQQLSEDPGYDGDGDASFEEVQEAPHFPGEVIDVGRGNNFREHVVNELLMIRDTQFIIFTNATCRTCKSGATELAKLA